MYSDNGYIELDDLDDLDDIDTTDLNDTQVIDSKLANQIADGLVPKTDDPLLPSFTLRVMIIGTIWNIFLAISNGIFSFRTTSFQVPGIFATLLSYPMGIFLSRILPRKKINIFGKTWELNDGDFSIKEHVLIYVIASGMKSDQTIDHFINF